MKKFTLYEVVRGSLSQAKERKAFLKNAGLKVKTIRKTTGIRGYYNYNLFTKPAIIWKH